MKYALILNSVGLLALGAGCGFISPSDLNPQEGGTVVIRVRPHTGASVIPRELGSIRHMVAVVVGISRYLHEGEGHPKLINLGYASADADAFASHLLNSGFNAVDLLDDEKATLTNVRNTVRERIKAAEPDDFVLLFWAGHGCADYHDPNKLYLITHDTDPDDMAHTAYAMTKFQEDIGSIKARRLMVIIDTCHSGGISDPTIAVRGANGTDIKAALRGVLVANDSGSNGSKAKVGVMRLIFTSCEPSEVSLESSKFGHGVFTHFLLKGLQGDADTNRDETVTLDEVLEYTRSRVRSFSRTRQNPATAGRFDRTIPMGVLKK